MFRRQTIRQKDDYNQSPVLWERYLVYILTVPISGHFNNLARCKKLYLLPKFFVRSRYHGLIGEKSAVCGI